MSKLKTNAIGGRALTVGVILVIAILLLDLLSIGNTQYVVKWIKCGTQPVVVQRFTPMGFGASPTKTTILTEPGLLEEKVGSYLGSNTSLFCSTQEVDRYLDLISRGLIQE